MSYFDSGASNWQRWVKPGEFWRLEGTEAEGHPSHDGLVGTSPDPSEQAVGRIEMAEVLTRLLRVAGDGIEMAEHPFEALAGERVGPPLFAQCCDGRAQGEKVPPVDRAIL